MKQNMICYNPNPNISWIIYHKP